MARNVDYSKWDRMNFSDSDNSDDDNDNNGEQGTGPCRVTRLDQPGRVTILPDGQVNVEETSSASAATSVPSSNATPAKVALPPTSTPATKTAIADTTFSPQEASHTTPTPKPPASWTSKGGFVEAQNLYWSQDRYAVTLRFQLPVSATASVEPKPKLAAGVLPWICYVTGLLPYNQRHAAVQSPTTDLSATLVIIDNTTGSEYFRDHIAYPIHAAQDDDDDDAEDHLTDWSIETWPADSPNKYLIVTLNKATPVPNMTIWWRRPVRSCPEIEMTTDHSASQSQTTFAAAWEQAHEQFLQGRQEQTRVEVDVGSDDEDDDDEP
jgi:hypothetical protein